jgi:CheY-like chemotaxis protein
MPGGGELTIETSGISVERQESGERYMVPLGNYVLCSVQDTGIGMSSETLQHIFEPFFTTKDPGKGTGLGLSTVYGIVKQNDGFVFADSKPGSGSCFTMYFPLVEEGELLVGEESRAPEQKLRGGQRILLVECEAKVRRYTKTVLQKYGYKVFTANGLSDALGLGKTLQVDLLITLCELADGSGFKLADRIRAMQPAVKVLMISEGTGDELTEVYETISRPFTSEALLRKIKKILE